MSSAHTSTAIAFLNSFNAHSSKVVRPFLDPSFVHTLGPRSINLPGDGVSNLEQFLAKLEVLTKIIDVSGFQLDPPKETIESPDAVMLRVECDGKLANQEPYLNSYIFTFRFASDGKITQCNAMTDSAYLNGVLAQEWVKELMAKGMQAK